MPGAFAQALRHAFALVDEARRGDGPHLRALHRQFAEAGLAYPAWAGAAREHLAAGFTLEGFACDLSRSLRPSQRG